MPRHCTPVNWAILDEVAHLAASMACPPVRKLGASAPQMGPPTVEALRPRRLGLLGLM